MSSMSQEIRQPATLMARSMTPPARSGEAAHLLVLLVPLIWLIVWEAAVQTGMLDHRWAPPPTNVIPQMLNLFRNGFVWPYLAITMFHLMVGYLLGITVGLLLQWLGARYSWLWDAARLLLTMLILCPLLPLLFVTAGYFRWIDPCAVLGVAGCTLLTVLWADRMDGREQCSRRGGVVSMLTSLRLAALLGLFVVLMLETLGRTNGLGYLLWRSWETFSAETFYAVMILVGLIAYLIWWVFDAIDWLGARAVRASTQGAG